MKTNLPEKTGGQSAHPRIDPDARFTPRDFAPIIAQVPDGCSMVGGQAVAWWAGRYGVRNPANRQDNPFTSKDIDFWGSRVELIQLAKALGHRAVFPHPYEMTVWVGAIGVTIGGKRTLVELLHTIPGLDTNNPETACVPELYEEAPVRKSLLIMTPVSLVLAKLHGLRHWDQEIRQDELHLRVSLETSRCFILELIKAHEIKQALWNCRRLIEARRLKPYRRLELEYGFKILDGIPIEDIEREAKNPDQPEQERDKLKKFCAVQWPRVLADG